MGMVLLDSRNPEYLPGGRNDEEGPAELACVIGVGTVVRLLFPDEFQRFVLAGGHGAEPAQTRFSPLEVF